MNQQASLETRGRQAYRRMRRLVTIMLSAALGIGAGVLLLGFWFPAVVGEREDLLLLLQLISVLLIAGALLCRCVLQSMRQRITVSQERQLQAMLSMFRVVKHELNNDMQVVMGNAELACMMLGEKDRASKPVGNICEAATQAIERIQQLSVFSSSEHEDLAAIDLNALLRETISRLNNEMPSTVEFRMELQPLPDRVLADRTLLSLSLSYLIRLAARSLPEGGEIVVRTSHLNGSADTGAIATMAEISVFPGLGGTPEDNDGSGRLSGERSPHEQSFAILQQAKHTTRALVERSGARILRNSHSLACESLIRMGFAATRRRLADRELVLEDELDR